MSALDIQYWNYRVTSYEVGGEPLYSVQEVYYDSNNQPVAFCDADVTGWEDPKDLEETLHKMLGAFTKPILGPRNLRVGGGEPESHEPGCGSYSDGACSCSPYKEV